MELITLIDERWRLTLPAKIKNTFDCKVFLGLTKNGCLIIYSDIIKFKGKKASVNMQIHIAKGKYFIKRILIPPIMRNATSFFFGRRVRLVKKRYRGTSFLEIQPWK